MRKLLGNAAKWAAICSVGLVLVWMPRTYAEPGARNAFPNSMSRVDMREAAAERNILIIDLRTPKPDPGI